MHITRRTLLAGLIAVPLSRREKEEISLGPTLLTFGELAEMLSLPERPIRCVGSLREHGAFVCLKTRSRVQIEKIVLHALDLTLVPGKDGVLLLQRLPAVTALEREWQRRLARYLESVLRNHIREDKKALQANPPLLSPEVRKSLQAEERTHYKAVAAQEDRAAMKQQEAFGERTNEIATPLYQHHAILYQHQKAREKEYELGILEGLVRRSLDEVVRQGRMRETYPVSAYLTAEQFLDLVPTDAEPAAAIKQYRESYSEITLYLRRTGRYLELRFEGGLYLGGQFQIQHFPSLPLLYIPDISPNTSTRAKKFPLLTTTLFEQIGNMPPLLGTTAHAWLEAERNRTQNILSQPGFQATFALTASSRKMGYPVPRWLSQAVEVWCQCTDAEAVMELYPLGGEYLSQTHGDGVTPEITMQETNLNQILLHCSDQWGVEEVEGVYLFRNYMAFLDRAHSFPLSAFLNLYRGLPPEACFEPPIYPQVAEYCRVAFRPSEATVQHWIDGPAMGYRNVNTDDLDACRAFLPLWEALNEEERQRAITWHDIEDPNKEPFRIPLTRFSQQDLLRIAEVLDVGHLLPLHPDFLKTLREDHLIISCYRGMAHRTKHVGPTCEILLRLEKSPRNVLARFLLPIARAPESEAATGRKE